MKLVTEAKEEDSLGRNSQRLSIIHLIVNKKVIFV